MGHETGKIAVLGTGAWGTTFAQVLADAGQDVTMWGRRQLIVDMINEGENSTYLGFSVAVAGHRKTNSCQTPN